MQERKKQELSTAAGSEVTMAVQQQPSLTPAGAVNTAAFYMDAVKYEQMVKLAEMMARGKTTIPAHLRGNPADCLAIIGQAMRWQMDPFAVAQKTHLVSGTLGYESQLVNAAINSIAPIRGRLNYEWYGPWERVIGKFTWAQGKNGKYQKPAWTEEDEKGCGVRVWSTLIGEEEPRVLDLLLSQATVRNSTLWASDPKQQLAYLAVKRWARLYCPDVILGVYTPDELQEGEYIDSATGRRTKNVTPSGSSRTEQLKQKLKKPEKAVETKAESLGKAKPAADNKPVKSVLVKQVIDAVGAPCEILTAYFQKQQSAQWRVNKSLEELSEENLNWILKNAASVSKNVHAFADQIGG